MSIYPEFDSATLRSFPFSQRLNKVQAEDFARPTAAGASFSDFLASLPRILAGKDLRTVAEKVALARAKKRAVVVSCGGHVIKCGLAPILIQLMEQGFLTALAVHGAVAIHDSEIALFGATSEDVRTSLQDGSFGMTAETPHFFNQAMDHACQNQLGAGEALGKLLLEQEAPYREQSLLASAYRLRIPVTVHIAIGTDIVHMHPGTNGAALGEASLRDFRILTQAMRSLADGGVLLNLGSAVVLPEVLLKAMALLRNESQDFTGFLGVNLDFIQQYRSNQQVVSRVEAIGGKGIALTGHHEIMIPLLALAILEQAKSHVPGD